MKTFKNVLPRAALIFVIFSLLCGIVYTAVVTGIAQLIFPNQANGSIIEVDGKSTAAPCWDSSTPMTPIFGEEL